MSAKIKQKQKPMKSEVVRDFVDTYPSAQKVKSELWELLIAAMGSEHADMWDRKQRADKLLMIELLGALVDRFYE
ncbi:hypothetical protein ACFOTA_00955 [Chitinophaga sp. GCM10012297]|uniref:Uncharacterized protein n=1 Tax=Chitinophaga chungangae TaxID=2821488 RepID=A0ABS3Y8D4_9BACT|nr:hypothetical protein [Chitinophaga chungangae]MBO9150760.1 hypothetical protein [Chitinophaga chungangae]